MTERMFEVYDTRTGNRVSVAVYFDVHRAWMSIERTRDLIAKGQRLDLADKIDFYSVRERLDSDLNN